MNHLLKLLNLRRHEVPRLLHAAAVFLLANVADGIVKSVAAAVFNSRAGVDQLPLMYTAIALFFSLNMVLLSVLSARVSRQRLLFGLMAGLAAVLVFNVWMLWREFQQGQSPLGEAFYPWLFISSELVRSLAGFQVWVMAGGICYTSRAKVFFPLFAASATIGDISGGFLVRLLGPLLQSWQLYALAALDLGVIVALMGPLVRRYFVFSRQGEEGGEGATLGENLRYFGRSRYLKALFVLSIAILALYTAIHYAFNVAAAAHYPTEAQTTGFFGLFYGATGIGTLVVTTFLLRLVLRWVGAGNVYTWVCGGYLLVALALSATFGGRGLFPELWTIFAFNLVNFLLLDSVVAPTYQVLIKLVPQRHSDGARMIMEGGFMLVGGLVGAGLSALHAQQILTLEQMFLALAALSAAMVVGGWYLKRGYTEVLIRAVREQDIAVDDANALESMRQLIAGSGEFARSLLQHRDDHVRQLGIEIIKKSPGPAAAAACLPLIDHENPRIRRAALEALGPSGAEEEGLNRILPRLGDEDAEVRQSAARALALRVGTTALVLRRQEVIGAVSPRLDQEADNAAVQAELCVVLEGLEDEGSAVRRRQLVQQLLDSEDVNQIDAGIRAAQQMPQSYPQVRAHLRHPHPAVREAAIRSLAERGGTPEEFIAVLADPDPDVVEAAVEALGRIAGDRQRQELVAALPGLQLKAWEGLLAALISMDDPALEPGLMASCRARLMEANRQLAAIQLLQPRAEVPAVGLMVDQLRLQIQLVQNGVIRLLGVLSDTGVVSDLLERLGGSDQEGRDQAVELLENIGDPALLKLLLPLVEADQEEYQPPEGGVVLEEVLAELLVAPDPWTQMAAVWTAASLDRSRLLDQLNESGKALAPQAGELVEQLFVQRGESAMSGADQPLTTMDKIAFLKGSSLFAALPLEELYHIALSMQEESVHQGAVVIKEGTRGDKMYIVVSGSLEVRKAAAGPQGPPIAVLAEKQVFGDMALLDDEPRSASVVAVSEVHLLSLQRRDLERILRRYSSIAFTMMRILSRRLREQMAA
ncbi:MAG: HEAT repeat domain-containing protein [Candidatus Latescibacteria bacterium]|nr:HEAT repeat domain-containing protein [Candidatus Latescibacterota bacterium]